MKLTNLHKALRNGAKLHGFRSGGGLRVFRVERSGGLLGYGEHTHAQSALAHLDLWLEKQPSDYKEFYGDKFPHYLTGSQETGGCSLDQWLLQGHDVDAHQEGGDVVVELHGWKHANTPQDVLERLDATGQPQTWEGRGYRYLTSSSRFPNGEPCRSTKITFVPDGKPHHRGFDYPVVKAGRGENFWAALDAAFEAEGVEENR